MDAIKTQIILLPSFIPSDTILPEFKKKVPVMIFPKGDIFH